MQGVGWILRASMLQEPAKWTYSLGTVPFIAFDIDSVVKEYLPFTSNLADGYGYELWIDWLVGL